MRSRTPTTAATYGTLVLAGAGSFMLPDALPAVRADDALAGGVVFLVGGPPAEFGYAGRFGDAMLEWVEFPTGRRCWRFVMASEVSGFQFAGPPGRMRLVTGHECTVGEPGVFPLEAEDGDAATISERDLELFNRRVLAACRNRNLNCSLELGASHDLSCVIEFERTLRDDDPQPDEVGEIVYFERGGGGGNSWIMLEAVDAEGRRRGRPIVVGPGELRPTTPRTFIGVYNEQGRPRCSVQEVSGTAIDLTRLGVDELRYLRVSTPSPGERGFPGGERAPDMKILGLITDKPREDARGTVEPR